MHPIRLFGLTLFVALLTLGCDQSAPVTSSGAGATTDTVQSGGKYSIAVIPKGATHPFWRSVHAGAQKAEKETGCQIIWMAPETENDRNQQIQLVQSFIGRGVDAIVLAPLDNRALVNPVETAVKRKIPVVIFDSSINTDVYESFVATDNKEGGRFGARRLGEIMGGKGKAIMMRYEVGSASTDNREEGFLEEIRAKYPDIELVSIDQYGGATKAKAQDTAQNLLTKYGDQIQGIFTPNESSTFGMMRALEMSGLAGKIQFVGFDASDSLIKGMRDGTIHGLVSQDPFNMGYTSVKTAVAVLAGQTVEKRIPTRLAMITPENLDTPEIQELVAPQQTEGK